MGTWRGAIPIVTHPVGKPEHISSIPKGKIEGAGLGTCFQYIYQEIEQEWLPTLTMIHARPRQSQLESDNWQDYWGEDVSKQLI